MAVYSIKEIEQLTRVKAHTLRIWERRYNLTLSKRSETNIRFYDEEDLKYLLQVTLLLDCNYKISHIALMSKDERAEKIMKSTQQFKDYEFFINQLILSMIELDEVAFDRILTAGFQEKGVEPTMQEIIFPFLERIGLMWIIGAVNPANEHFISNLIRQKLIAAIDQLPIPSMHANPTYMLFLPERELHELTLLFLNYILRTRGFHTLYLGQNTPVEDVKSALEYYKASFLCTILTSNMSGELEHLLFSLQTLAKNTRVMVAGRLAIEVNVKDYPDIEFIFGAKAVIDWIETNANKKQVM